MENLTRNPTYSSPLQAIPRCKFRPLWGVISIGRRNTFGKSLSGSLILQGLSWPFIELPGNSAQFGLGVLGKICSFGKVLPQQTVGVFV